MNIKVRTRQRRYEVDGGAKQKEMLNYYYFGHTKCIHCMLQTSECPNKTEKNKQQQQYPFENSILIQKLAHLNTI